MKRRYLVLESGEAFEGKAFGADAAHVGELVFTTGMVGYVETLTDPSYRGQIILQTFPLIGNYGTMAEDIEGACLAGGYVVREWCDRPSNFRSEGTVDAFLKAHGVPGIAGVDTRELARILRERGTMKAAICDALPPAVAARAIEAGVERRDFPAQNARFRLAVIDHGTRRNVFRALNRRGCSLSIFPPAAGAEEILTGGFDGLVLGEGPGDPADCDIAGIAKLAGRLPIFGIGLGHQLLARAQGGRTAKLRCGHRGDNHPVRDLLGTRTFITSQNHGYIVDTTPGLLRYTNANDNTCEGIDYPALNAFSVQFHPTDAEFDRFVSMLGGAPHADA